MLEAPSQLKNVKQVHIAERGQKIPMVKVSVGQATFAHLILQNHYLQSQDFSPKVLETKNKNLAVLVHIRMNMEQLNANIVQREVNAQISRWDGTILARLELTVSSYLRLNARSVQQELILIRLVLIISTNVRIAYRSIIVLTLV